MRGKESKRLLEAVAAKLAEEESAAPRRPLTKREAETIRREAEARRKLMRENGMRARLAAHIMPWKVALLVAALSSSTWLTRWLADRTTGVTIAATICIVVAWAGWMAGRRILKWRRQIHIATGAAVAWLLWAGVTGPSWSVAFWWLTGTVACSMRWWRHNRLPHPLAPNRDRVPVPVLDESVPALWDRNLGAKGRILAGSELSGEDTSKPNCRRYYVDLVEGMQTPSQVLGCLGLIAGGLRTPVKQVVLEPDPDEDPNRVLLTIVEKSPIDETMPYQGARLSGSHRHLIDIGPYGDGDGYAKWRMWQPGETPMTGSWLSGFVVGGTGIGKSRLMELLAAGYMASGNAVVWFIDPQGGASSPALKEHADWYVDGDGVDAMLAALERIAKDREKENSGLKWTRFDPSHDRPGIIVFIDECHDVFNRNSKRWAALARKTQKVGIGFVGLTQEASLSSFQEEALRAALLTNAIIMRTESKTQGQLIPGIEVDPLTLPSIPGFGYSLKRQQYGRTAPFRSEYVADPAHWFQRYPMPTLDNLSAAAAGEVYTGRRETAEAQEKETLEWIEAMRNGEAPPTRDEPDLDDWGKDEPATGAFQTPSFPPSPFQPRPQDKSMPDRIVAVVANGTTRTAEIGKAVGLKPSQLHEHLKKLLEGKHLEQPTRGVYAVAGSASAPER